MSIFQMCCFVFIFYVCIRYHRCAHKMLQERGLMYPRWGMLHTAAEGETVRIFLSVCLVFRLQVIKGLRKGENDPDPTMGYMLHTIFF